mgnify:CR=1 FL=1
MSVHLLRRNISVEWDKLRTAYWHIVLFRRIELIHVDLKSMHLLRIEGWEGSWGGGNHELLRGCECI